MNNAHEERHVDSDDTLREVLDRVIYLGGLTASWAMTFLNENANGIQALCSIFVTAIVVWKFVHDKSSDNKGNKIYDEGPGE